MEKTSKTIFAVAYYRYSSNSQTEASIERQQLTCQEYAKSNNICIIHEYIDRACTGKNTDRDGFEQMLLDAPKHSFTLVLVYALNRLGRNVLNTSKTIDMLSKQNITVYSVTERFDDSCTGNLMRHIAMGFDEYYSDELSQKILGGNRIAASKGLSLGKFRLGYKIVNRHYEIDEKTAPIVKELFRKYAYDGASMNQLLMYLENSGIKNMYGENYKWHSLNRILTNRMYVGEYWVSGNFYGKLVPQIVDENDFELVQKRIGKNKMAPARNTASNDGIFYLTTKLFSDKGTPMTGKSGTSHTGRKYYYYSCSRSKNVPRDCTTKSIKKDLLEKQVVEHINSILTEANIKAIAKEVVTLSINNPYQAEILSIRAEIAQNKVRISNLLKAIENGQAIDVLTTQLETREAEQEKLNAKLAELNMYQNEFTESDVIDFLSQYKIDGSYSNSFTANLINILVNKVVVSTMSDGKVKVTVTCNTHNDHSTPAFFEGTGSPYCMLGGAEGN